MEKNNFNKKGQIAIFVVIALVIVAGIAGYFLLKDRIVISGVPSEYQPIYDNYISCLEDSAADGLSILGTQGGYIETPEFEPGSEYAPFSSQLDFLGFGVPYWYYVSQNGIIKDQVPTLSSMEDQLADYIATEALSCDFSSFIEQGYEIKLEEASASADIVEGQIDFFISQDLVITKLDDDKVEVFSSHRFDVKSDLAEFFDIAKGVYDHEIEEMFLENYAIDVLNIYAPVTGTEESCVPLTWNALEVLDSLKTATSANINAVKFSGDYYDLDADDNGYFVVDRDLELEDKQVNFVFDSRWPSRFEVWPTESNLMISEVVGPEQGLGVAGFCYVSYKYVYDMYFPVLVQLTSLSNPEEIFQFPMAVVVTKNQAREAINSEPLVEVEPLEVCENANTDLTISTYDVFLNPVEANVSFKCFNDVCRLGQTFEGDGISSLDAVVPQCTNGLLKAEAPGYKTEELLVSTNEVSFVDLILESEKELDVEIYVDDRLTGDTAILTLSQEKDGIDEYVSTAAYPGSSRLTLSEGDYKFVLKVFEQDQITLPESTEYKCFDVPKEGIAGVLGLKDEQCYDYVIPSQTLTHVLYAGGEEPYYVTQSELVDATKIKVYTDSTELPTEVEDLQETYYIIEAGDLDIEIV